MKEKLFKKRTFGVQGTKWVFHMVHDINDGNDGNVLTYFSKATV